MLSRRPRYCASATTRSRAPCTRSRRSSRYSVPKAAKASWMPPRSSANHTPQRARPGRSPGPPRCSCCANVMVRHRDTTPAFVTSSRTGPKLQRLGTSSIRGRVFEVDRRQRPVASSIARWMVARSRTNQLSGGAKEQLGILARLAGAALVAKEDAVPILIDDALGFHRSATAGQDGSGLRHPWGSADRSSY